MFATGRLRALLSTATAVLALLAATAITHGQDAGVRVTMPTLTELEYPLIQAVVNVEDTTATTPGSLTKDSFVATIDSQPAAVTGAELASSQTIPLDVLMLMDTSGSTEGDGLAQAKAAAVSFIRGLAPEDRVAVMRFANSVTLQQDYTTDKEAAIAAINALSSSGQTETYKATDAAIRQAATSSSLRRAMILLTDGAADAIVTGITAQDALTTASLSGVPVFTIAQGAAIEDPSFLIELAGVTDGQYLEAPGSGDLQGVYASIGRILQNQYLVTIDASAAAGKPASTIGLQVNSGGRSGAATAQFVPGPAFVAPNVVVTGLAAGEALTEPRDVTVTAGGSQPITKAAFYVDDVNVFETTTAPFTYTYDPDKFGESTHTLRVAVTVGDGIIDGEAVSFSSVPSVPVAVDDPAGASEGGSSLPILPIAAIVAVVALIGIGYAVIQRIRTTSGPTLAMVSPDQRVTPWTGQHRTISKAAQPSDESGDASSDPEAAPAVQDIGETLGVLISRSGSDAGQLYPVGGKPVSLGNGDTCGVHIADASLASEEARLWIRNGTLMYHRMTRLTTIAFEGAPGGWQMLEPGESFSIGAHTFEFKLLPEGVPTEEALADLRPAPAQAPVDTPSHDVPNILRERPEPAPPIVLPQPGSASADRPRRLTEMMPRDMGFGHQDVDAPDEQAS